VSGVVGVSPGTPDGPGEAEFYPDTEGTVFEDCLMCKWPNLDIDDVVMRPVAASEAPTIEEPKEEQT